MASKVKKISKTHQKELVRLAKVYNLPLDRVEKMMMENPELFSGTTRGPAPTIVYAGTTKTTQLPSMLVKQSRVKGNEATNVETPALKEMRLVWKELVEPVYNALVDHYADSHNLPVGKMDLNFFRNLVTKLRNENEDN